MFKENKEFWLYFIGIILLFFIIFFGLRSYFRNSSFSIEPNLSFTENTNPTPAVTQEQVNSLDINKDYYAVISTNIGDLKIDLFERNAPNTVMNFISLSTKDYYDETKFHRLLKDVLLQGGSRNTLNEDPEDDKYGNPGYTIADEINWDSLDFSQDLQDQLTSEGYSSESLIASKDIEKYRIAMASSGPNTNGSQFFFVLGDPSNIIVDALKGRHTVFGQVVENTELLDEINEMEVDDDKNISPRPIKDIIIEDIEIFISNKV